MLAETRVEIAWLQRLKFENVVFGHFSSRRLELTNILERGLVFECHSLLSNFGFSFDVRPCIKEFITMVTLPPGLEKTIRNISFDTPEAGAYTRSR